ncbi:hypothetical protein L6452_37138 [Arctium lappa]|uniref:Uncharacterized protein n=1 Tax=Arctium lappa TaxID=4217 RepID=A0ACB8Y2V0_ARCLA|nr:hypothetical protein L6452_37138 [Arctium lappa]
MKQSQIKEKEPIFHLAEKKSKKKKDAKEKGKNKEKATKEKNKEKSKEKTEKRKRPTEILEKQVEEESPMPKRVTRQESKKGPTDSPNHFVLQHSSSCVAAKKAWERGKSKRPMKLPPPPTSVLQQHASPTQSE